MDIAAEFPDFALDINDAVQRAVANTWSRWSASQHEIILKAVAKHGGAPYPPRVVLVDDFEPTVVTPVNDPRLPNSRGVRLPQLVSDARAWWDEQGPSYKFVEFTLPEWQFVLPEITGMEYDQITNTLRLAAHRHVYRVRVWTPSDPELEGTDNAGT